jgi:hypothetical protein
MGLSSQGRFWVDQSQTRDRTRTFVAIIAMVLIASVISAPVASAINSVFARIKSTSGGTIKASGGAVWTKQQGGVKVQDSGGGAVESSPVTFNNAPFPPTGAGSTGAIDVKSYAGGGSFLGAGDCTTATGGADIGAGGQGLPNTVVVPAGTIITALLVNGTDGQVKVTSALPALAAIPGLQRYRVTPNMPNVTAAFGSGLAITDALTFEGINAADNGVTETAGECNFVVIGQDL